MSSHNALTLRKLGQSIKDLSNKVGDEIDNLGDEIDKAGNGVLDFDWSIILWFLGVVVVFWLCFYLIPSELYNYYEKNIKKNWESRNKSLKIINVIWGIIGVVIWSIVSYLAIIFLITI